MSHAVLETSYSALKTYMTAKGLAAHGVEDAEKYVIIVVDGSLQFVTTLFKSNKNDDLADFEANVKPTWNKVIAIKDSDGTDLTRPKVTALGWTLQDHHFDFQLGTKDSLYSKKADGTDFNFSTIEFYELVDSVETLITGDNAADQSYLTANAVRTDIIWEPTHDVDVISGELRCEDDINVDVRFWTVVVPDIPAIYGGSKELITGGRNLRYLRQKEPFYIEGRTVKHLAYSGTYHTNKFLLRFRHPTGFNGRMGMAIDFYKA